MELNETEVQAVAASYARVAKASAPVLKAFYANLFDAYPSTEGPFILKGSTPNTMMWASIGVLVQNAADLEGLKKSMNQLGYRHALVGAKAAQLSQFADILLGTIAEANGDDWTDTHETGWEKLLGFAVEHMIGGMPQPESNALVIDTRRKTDAPTTEPAPLPVEPDKDEVLRQIVRAAMGDAPVAAPTAHVPGTPVVPKPPQPAPRPEPPKRRTALPGFKLAKPNLRRDPPPPTPVDKIVIPPVAAPEELRQTAQRPSAQDYQAMKAAMADNPSAATSDSTADQTKPMAQQIGPAQPDEAAPTMSEPPPSKRPTAQDYHAMKAAMAEVPREDANPSADRIEPTNQQIGPVLPGVAAPPATEHTASKRPTAQDYQDMKAAMAEAPSEDADPVADRAEPTAQPLGPLLPDEAASPATEPPARKRPSAKDYQAMKAAMARGSDMPLDRKEPPASPASPDAALLSDSPPIDNGAADPAIGPRITASPDAGHNADNPQTGTPGAIPARPGAPAPGPRDPEVDGEAAHLLKSRKPSPPSLTKGMPDQPDNDPVEHSPPDAPPITPPKTSRTARPSADDYEAMRASLRQHVLSTPPAQSD